jgi:predicted DNA-binding transcriptional regulator
MLEKAVTHGHATTIKTLLQRGKDIDVSEVQKYLLISARKGFFEIVRMLLDAGVGANQGSPTPIVYAVESEHTSIFLVAH